jgi:adenosylmethionine-8-amino-7-oxononanoate aminotransferase
VLAAAVEPLRSAPLVTEIRAGLGLLAAIELDADARAADPGLVDRVVHACRDEGVLTRGLAGRALQISPPYVISQSQLERVAAGMAAALETIAASAAAA